jgi:hypothetical protein
LFGLSFQKLFFFFFPFVSYLTSLQMASESKATPASKKEPLPVEKKLEMSLGDIEKARPRQRKVFFFFFFFFLRFFLTLVLFVCRT